MAPTAALRGLANKSPAGFFLKLMDVHVYIQLKHRLHVEFSFNIQFNLIFKRSISISLWQASDWISVKGARQSR